MPVLLLAQGDASAKDLLRNAIEARYGTRPPALDSLKIDFKGRTRVKVGPVNTWVPLDMVAYFRFPTAMRWDFVAKPMGLAVQRGIDSFDGETYRSNRGGKAPTVVEDAEIISSMRRRLWAVASILLTPISDMFVKLEATGANSLIATNTKLDDSAELFMRDDHGIDHVKVNTLNPDTGNVQDYFVRLSTELTNVDDLLMPSKISMFWDDKPSFEIEPVKIESNPTIDDTVFTLADETS